MKDNCDFFKNENNDKIVCLNICKTYRAGDDVYECAKKYWHLNGERAKSADFVFAVFQGRIVGVFKPVRWYLTDSKEHEGRWEFEGEIIDASPYLGKDISHYVGKSQNPVMYINM